MWNRFHYTVFVLCFLFQNCTLYEVENNSMEPTLMDGDVLIGVRIQQNVGVEDLRGRIVISHFPIVGEDELFVKRCVAVAGDSVCIVRGVCLNNSVQETWGKEIDMDTLKNSYGVWMVITNNSTYHRDNILNLSEILVPAEGDTVTVSEETLALYRGALFYETVRYGGSFPLLGDKYVFKSDYVFLCGDNMLHSFDSRQWGVVPLECMVSMVININ